MTKNRVVSLSYRQGSTYEALTVTRDSRRKIYYRPTLTSLQRVCRIVSYRAHRQEMGIDLWNDGWCASPLLERV